MLFDKFSFEPHYFMNNRDEGSPSGMCVWVHFSFKGLVRCRFLFNWFDNFFTKIEWISYHPFSSWNMCFLVSPCTERLHMDMLMYSGLSQWKAGTVEYNLLLVTWNKFSWTYFTIYISSVLWQTHPHPPTPPQKKRDFWPLVCAVLWTICRSHVLKTK